MMRLFACQPAPAQKPQPTQPSMSLGFKLLALSIVWCLTLFVGGTALGLYVYDENRPKPAQDDEDEIKKRQDQYITNMTMFVMAAYMCLGSLYMTCLYFCGHPSQTPAPNGENTPLLLPPGPMNV